MRGQSGSDVASEHVFPANDGRIASQRNHLTGEDVQYQYDTLARLTRAETTQTGGAQWGQQFGYDGFGNLLSKTVVKGSAPMMNLTVDGLTNRITAAGYAYDAAGNMTQMPYSATTQTLEYDAFNRVTQVSNSDGVQRYRYNWRGQRTQVTKGGQTNHFFYLPDGRLLGRYRQVAGQLVFSDGTRPEMVWESLETFQYFGGRLVAGNGALAATDRLGSVGDGSAHHPYGEDRTAAAGAKVKHGWRVTGTSTSTSRPTVPVGSISSSD